MYSNSLNGGNNLSVFTKNPENNIIGMNIAGAYYICLNKIYQRLILFIFLDLIKMIDS